MSTKIIIRRLILAICLISAVFAAAIPIIATAAVTTEVLYSSTRRENDTHEQKGHRALYFCKHSMPTGAR